MGPNGFFEKSSACANFAKGLAGLGKKDGVNVNVIHPGTTETDRILRQIEDLIRHTDPTCLLQPLKAGRGVRFANAIAALVEQDIDARDVEPEHARDAHGQLGVYRETDETTASITPEIRSRDAYDTRDPLIPSVVRG